MVTTDAGVDFEKIYISHPLEKILVEFVMFSYYFLVSVNEARAHCGANYGHFETSITQFPTSEGVSEVSEQISERSGARERSELCGASKRVSSANERANG